MQAQTITEAELTRQRGFIEKLTLLNDDAARRTGARKTAFVQTFGCQQNVSDSEKLKGMLAAMGYDEAPCIDQADVALFNTCAVREHAEQRVYGNVGALKPVKAGRPGMIIGVCGCMMQQEHVAAAIKERYSFVDLVFGTGALHRMPELLYRVITDKKRVFDRAAEDVIAEGLPLRREDGVRAWLPISYGCNNFCTYCVVPYVRGRERSRQPEAVLEEARELIGQGYKDITLLGQNVNSYGNDADFGYNFSRLLREINDMPGEFRLRFMTSHPKDATRELFETVASCAKISKHIHLPFQAGSNEILRRMNRRYTRESYLALVAMARETIPGLSLTSDVIVGFPGETYEDFLRTVDVVREVEFDNIYTFIYSKRHGTPAEKMADPVPHEEKAKWFAELLAVQDEIGRRRLRACEGKVFRVLCEGPAKTGGGMMTGRLDTGTIVDFPAGEDAAGRFLDVEIIEAGRLMLRGRPAGAPGGQSK